MEFMKFILITLFICVAANLQAQEYFEITYSDSYDKGESMQITNIPFLEKNQRVRSNSAKITVSNYGELEEPVKHVIDYVKSVWQSHIVDSEDIYIKIQFSDNIEEDIQTKVSYIQKDGIIYPLSLNAYLDRFFERDHAIPDGVIFINSKTQWDYALGDNITSDGKNLAWGLMRAMARIMGFGSDVVINDNKTYSFSEKRYHTIFNTKISNSSNVYLKDIQVNKTEPNAILKSYIEDPGQTFWVLGEKSKYKLAPLPYSKDNPPFVYLDPQSYNSSLMCSNLSSGNYVLQIDNETQDILNGLGWNTRTPLTIKIIGKDVPETGLASAYDSHGFTIEGNDGALTNPQWNLMIPKLNGEMEFISLKDENFSCVTPPILDVDTYKINSDGDIEAQLFFSCQKGAQEINAAPFNIFFELKPMIEYAEITEIHDNAPYKSYDAYYRVKYRGADHIMVSVEEENSPKLKSWFICEPYIVTGIADHITSPYYAWMDFIVENKYGKAVHTIEMQPYGIITAQRNKKHAIRQSNIQNKRNLDVGIGEGRIEVYDAAGIRVATLDNISEIDKIPNKGLLLIKRFADRENLETIKMLRK